MVIYGLDGSQVAQGISFIFLSLFFNFFFFFIPFIFWSLSLFCLFVLSTLDLFFICRDGWEVKWAGNDVAIQYYTNGAYAWVGEYTLPFNTSSAIHKYAHPTTSPFPCHIFSYSLINFSKKVYHRQDEHFLETLR
jgi:hypothetical protein